MFAQPGVHTFNPPTIVIGPDDEPIVTYDDDDGDKLVHCGDPTCSVPVTATELEHPASAMLLVDGNPLIVSNEGVIVRCDDLACAPDAGNGTGEQVQNFGSHAIGWSASAALDSEGRPVIASMSGLVDQRLQLMRCGTPTCTATFGTSRPLKDEVYAQHPDIAIGADGSPVIATSGTPAVVYCADFQCNEDDVTWTSIAVAGDGALLNSGPSIAIGHDGYPIVALAISPWSGEEGQTYVIDCDDPGCRPGIGPGDTVAAVDLPGTMLQPDLVLDAAGNPVLAYPSPEGVRVMHCDDPGCMPGVGNGAGEGIARFRLSMPDTVRLALTTAGNPVVAFSGAEQVGVVVCDDPHCSTNDTTGTPPGATYYMPVEPIRVFDSRPGQLAAGPEARGPIEGGTSVGFDLMLGSRDPAVVAVVGTVTVTEATAPTYVSIGHFRQGETPKVSSVNVPVAGLTRANGFIVDLGPSGRASVYSRATAHVVVDVTGYLVMAPGPMSSGRIIALDETARILDTREDEAAPGPKGRVAAGAVIRPAAAGVGGVPASAQAVVVNLGLVDPAGPSYLRAWGGGPQPATSNVNSSGPGLDPAVSGLAIVQLDDDGHFNIFAREESDVYADVVAYVTGAESSPELSGMWVPLSDAQRVFDTRLDALPLTGPKGTVRAGTEITADLLPSTDQTAGLVTLNLTGTSAAAAGYVTTYARGSERTRTSALNLAGSTTGAPDTRANLVFAPVDPAGQTTFFTLRDLELLGDASGYTLP